MKQHLINDVIQGMIPYLDNAQAEKLQEVLQHTLFNYKVVENKGNEEISEQNLVELFLSAKRIEGCSEKSLKYYESTITSIKRSWNRQRTSRSMQIKMLMRTI